MSDNRRFAPVLALRGCIIMLAIVVVPGISAAADPLFAEDTILEVRIVAPFDSILTGRASDEDTAGKFIYTDHEGDLVEFDIGIRTRGRYRLQADVCSFPPLRLNFKKSQVRDTLFDSQDKMKLVTHCRNSSGLYEQALLAEYLAYRVMNEVADTSFQVRLLRIQYETPGAESPETSYGVLIEHKKRLAKRMNLAVLDQEKTSVAALQPDYTNLVAIFQYLIANTDFAPTIGSAGQMCCHNFSLFSTENDVHYSVPYDFDMSGWVNASYATPNPKLRLDSVEDRLYRGFCANNELLPASLDLFRGKRDAIESLVETQTELSARKRTHILDMVAEFYEEIDNPRVVKRRLTGRCR